ncbi:Hypothetical_protein [Hexamita inflata]|uniref:Hypothetical_protein n=1 Tax=Hexamita inflata TaxID=28002 RepID=A0ABP1IKT5_9EUKA
MILIYKDSPVMMYVQLWKLNAQPHDVLKHCKRALAIINKFQLPFDIAFSILYMKPLLYSVWIYISLLYIVLIKNMKNNYLVNILQLFLLSDIVSSICQSYKQQLIKKRYVLSDSEKDLLAEMIGCYACKLQNRRQNNCMFKEFYTEYVLLWLIIFAGGSVCAHILTIKFLLALLWVLINIIIVAFKIFNNSKLRVSIYNYYCQLSEKVTNQLNKQEKYVEEENSASMDYSEQLKKDASDSL